MTYSDVRQTAIRWGVPERRVTTLCRNNRIIGAKKEGKSWLIPSDAELPFDGRTREAAEEKAESTANHTTVAYTSTGARERVYTAFEQTYGKTPQNVVFTPYRICPIGAHVDHNLGKFTGFALDKGIYMAFGPKQNGIIEIRSLQFPKRAQWHALEVPRVKEDDWADYLRGATIALSSRYPLRTGLCAVIDGELPIGGLSSSAAVLITFISELAELNNIRLTLSELVVIAREAENKYVGSSSGKLNYSCELYCRQDQLLYYDTADDSYELIKAPKDMKPYEIVLFFSGVERSLESSKYNMRVDECRSAAYALMAFAGMEYRKFDETSLREVPYEVYLEHQTKLPENWVRRAEHWYSEQRRVEAGIAAWRKGDIAEFGRLSFESGKSSIENWETGSPELIKLYEILTHVQGIYGGRFLGSGFKGCCMALIDPAYETAILEQVKKEYLEAFPRLKDKYSAHICHTADGVRL